VLVYYTIINVIYVYVHTYKCSCLYSIIYLNICKHIHAYDNGETIVASNYVLLPSDYRLRLTIDNGYLLPSFEDNKNSND